MATYTKFLDFTEKFATGVHDFDTHVFKVMLTLTAPVNTNTVKADLTEIAAGNGYTAGGETTTLAVSETTGVTTVTGTQVSWTGGASAMANFRYAVLYNDTSASDNLIAFWDYGSTVTVATGETFTAKFNNASPGTIFTLT